MVDLAADNRSPEMKKRKSGVLAISAAKLARRLGVSLRHLRRLDSAGKLPKPIRLGRSVRWSVQEIKSWIKAGAPDRSTWQALKKHSA